MNRYQWNIWKWKITHIHLYIQRWQRRLFECGYKYHTPPNEDGSTQHQLNLWWHFGSSWHYKYITWRSK